MINRTHFAAMLLCLLAGTLSACGDDHDHGADGGSETGGDADDHGHEHPEEGPHGGSILELGAHKGHLEVMIDHDKKMITAYTLDAEFKPVEVKEAIRFNMMADGKPVQLTGTRMSDRAGWTFTHEALAGDPDGGRFRVVMGGATYTPEMAHDHDDHDDHGHEHGDEAHHDHGHDHGPNHGELAAFEGAAKGQVELKLHDDKGDLELWLTQDGKPYDLPLDTKISVTFTDRDNKVVMLQARNKTKNEDEDGNANIRDGKTNYFIFPGDTGADAAWLQGKAFLATVTVSFSHDGDSKTSAFELKPHTH